MRKLQRHYKSLEIGREYDLIKFSVKGKTVTTAKFLKKEYDMYIFYVRGCWHNIHFSAKEVKKYLRMDLKTKMRLLLED